MTPREVPHPARAFYGVLLFGAGHSFTIGAANPAGRTVPAPRPDAGGR